MMMALTEINGDNETNIGFSKSLSFDLYDEKHNEIQVINQVTMPIEIWIARDKNLPIQSFKLIDAINTNASNNFSSWALNGAQFVNGFIVDGFNLSGFNQSIHIQIKPVNKSVSYLTLLKFGDNPSFQYYDIINFFCPTDLITENGNESYYLLFANMSKVNAFKGYVGFSIFEANSNSNCMNKSSFNSIDYLSALSARNQTNSSSFSSNFELRTYLSGCYYTDPLTNKWSSYGMEILFDSNLTHAHCQTSHLTVFASGFIVLPNAINFNYVWSNASFLQNIVVYCTVITLVSSYILLAIWAIYMDSNDRKKEGITILGDLDLVDLNNKYIYEIIVFTGERFNAGTSSYVSIIFYWVVVGFLFMLFWTKVALSLARSLKKSFEKKT